MCLIFLLLLLLPSDLHMRANPMHFCKLFIDWKLVQYPVIVVIFNQKRSFSLVKEPF